MNDRKISLSIIIVNYRCWQDLGRCLDSLESTARDPAQATEVIVVDNHSNDDQLPMFAPRYAWVAFYKNTCNGGFANGCNTGAKQAHGQYLLFLNPDTYDPGQQITRLLAVKKNHPEVAILAPRLSNPNRQIQKSFDRFPSPLRAFGIGRTILRWFAPKRNPQAHKVKQPLIQVDWVSGAALLIDQAHWQRLGGWCEDFWMYSEDVDLCKRASNAGLICAYTTEANVVHRHGGASRADFPTSAKTKAETLISRHLYGRRHLHGWRHALYQGVLFLTRYLPMTIAALIQLVSRRYCPRSLALRASIFIQLSQHYRRILTQGCWLSPRAIAARKTGPIGDS